MDIKIEKGIPVPSNGTKGEFPFHEMDVGDSFLVPEGRKRSVSSAACYYSGPRGKGSGKKFAVLRQKDGSYRCWRLK